MIVMFSSSVCLLHEQLLFTIFLTWFAASSVLVLKEILAICASNPIVVALLTIVYHSVVPSVSVIKKVVAVLGQRCPQTMNLWSDSRSCCAWRKKRLSLSRRRLMPGFFDCASNKNFFASVKRR
ncbi:hypothetical protein BofuT4_P023780.1 [Botrytis cinerea T4]|uniref:Uncharacterized protein n=1 Tax=Botryotinia fuckeliana (strain T4) TaxID=999810 RepID=G2YFM1_BOTF4|nr:hypothetical protein BofuT4_P023780.1 [Botrytis cinerea T4]